MDTKICKWKSCSAKDGSKLTTYFLCPVAVEGVIVIVIFEYTTITVTTEA
jgi:hypothetical protein